MEENQVDIAEFVQGLDSGSIIKPKECEGCNNWLDTKCIVYRYSELQHSRIFGCAARTHNKVVSIEDKKMLNPLKAAKRSMRRK